MQACLIVIGNEILSGRTQDTHIAWLAKELGSLGISLAEVRVIPDREDVIVSTVNACRKAYDYVFTTGGIGPTHDDITAAAIAKAFGVKLARDVKTARLFAQHYGDKLNAARLKMADMPEGAEAIENPVSVAPGFRVENVYVLAGVPMIMRAMWDAIRPTLKGGARMLSKTVSAYTTEGTFAEKLTEIQNRFPDVEIGSYPFVRDKRLGASLVARSTDAARLDAAYAEIKKLLLGLTPEVFDDDLANT